jgi:thiamine-phosphate pyrophosphorylase
MALAVPSAGVHLGQDDLPPQDARRLAGEKLIIGRSTHSLEQARHAVEVEQADYIAVGAVYSTETKPEHTLAGVSLAQQVCGLGLPVPIFAIGGITVDRAKELKAAGVKRVAVSSAIVAAADPQAETRRFVEAMAS